MQEGISVSGRNPRPHVPAPRWLGRVFLTHDASRSLRGGDCGVPAVAGPELIPPARRGRRARGRAAALVAGAVALLATLAFPSLASAGTGRAYVANVFSNNVTPIDTATNTAGTAIGVGSGP